MSIKDVAKKLSIAQRKLNKLEIAIREQKALTNAYREDMAVCMKEAGTVAYSGHRMRISMRSSEVPQATDWPKIYRYIKRNNAFDLIQRRLATGAWRDRLEDRKDPIPGIESFTKSTLYITLKED